MGRRTTTDYYNGAPMTAGQRWSREQLDALLANLDDIARTYDRYEHGLPMDDEHMELMREVILLHLAPHDQEAG